MKPLMRALMAIIDVAIIHVAGPQHSDDHVGDLAHRHRTIYMAAKSESIRAESKLRCAPSGHLVTLFHIRGSVSI